MGAFFERARDPRRYWITVYESDQGPVFAGGNRLHPSQAAEAPFMDADVPLLPVIEASASDDETVRLLLDTSAPESWLTMQVADRLGFVPFGPTAYERLPDQVIDEIPGVLGAVDTLIIKPLHIETALFCARLAWGPLGLASRAASSNPPDGVMGCNLLEAFSFVQVDYTRRRAVFSTETEYQPAEDRLMASVPLKRHRGAMAVEGRIDGRPETMVIDTAGDYALALPEPVTVKRLSVGDVMALNLIAAEARAKNLGDPEQPRIGYEFLSRFVVTFDFKRRLVHFERPPEAPGAGGN